MSRAITAGTRVSMLPARTLPQRAASDITNHNTVRMAGNVRFRWRCAHSSGCSSRVQPAIAPPALAFPSAYSPARSRSSSRARACSPGPLRFLARHRARVQERRRRRARRRVLAQARRRLRRPAPRRPPARGRLPRLRRAQVQAQGTYAPAISSTMRVPTPQTAPSSLRSAARRPARRRRRQSHAFRRPRLSTRRTPSQHRVRARARA